MPIFGGSKRPKLDGLTRDEQKRRDALNPEVLRRTAGGVQAPGPAAAAVLQERLNAEPRDLLWPLLLGSQLMSLQRFGRAITAFEAALELDQNEVRAHYGAAMASYRAAEYKLDHGEAATDEIAPADMTVDNLYQTSLRHFHEAMDLTPDKNERDELAAAAATVRRAIARKAGRL
jgi:tetratricopeptide (TPR) repeat protein